MKNHRQFLSLKLCRKVHIFISGFKFIDYFLVNKEVTTITILMQTQAKFCLGFSKVNTKLFLCSVNTIINIISSFSTFH